MYPSAPLFVTLLLIIKTAAAIAVHSAQCYISSNNVTEQEKRSPCGIVNSSSFLSCCGVGDKCLQDGLCSTVEKAGSLAAGYYVGGCTDPTLSDATCNPACGDLNRNSIVYNATSNQWQCCGMTNGEVNCSNPTDESFSAPAPTALSATYTIGASSSNTASATSAPVSSSGLSGGAKAGIAVGCTLTGLLILGAIAFLFMRRRRQHHHTLMKARLDEKADEQQQLPPLGGNTASPTSHSHVSSVWGLTGSTVHPATEKPVEKYSELEGGHSGRFELPGSQAAQAELSESAAKHEMP